MPDLVPEITKAHFEIARTQTQTQTQILTLPLTLTLTLPLTLTLTLTLTLSSCGQCGGGGCEDRPGGSQACCIYGLVAANRNCRDVTDVGCIVRLLTLTPAWL